MPRSDPDYDPDETIHWDAPDDVWGFYATPDPYSRYEHGILDGDTWDLLIDQGFNDYRRARVRAVHIDTAEINTPKKSREYLAADAHRDFAREWMAEAVTKHDGNWPLVVRTRAESGSFGRWLAEVFDRDGNSLEREMIDVFGDDPFFDYGRYK